MATKHQRFAELAEEAEKSVQGVKDPELRRIAYQKILEDLLGGQTGAPSNAKKGRSEPKAKAAKATAAKKKGGPQAYVQELVDEAFFKKPKTIAQVKAELENLGHHIPLTSLSGPLQKLVQRRILRRTRNDGVFSYSNW